MTVAATPRPDTDKIAAALQDQCIDWNGAKLSDESETRNSIYCGQLRAILAERGQLRVNLRHWREECGKLHASLDAHERLIEEMREALEPFAHYADAILALPNVSNQPDGVLLVATDPHTVGDYRRARAAALKTGEAK